MAPASATPTTEPPLTHENASSAVTMTARTYYNSSDADTFYHTIWGGSDIHIGLYNANKPNESIATASQRTVEHMASLLGPITSATRILDMGAGYGGAARYLAQTYGCKITCLNLSEVENRRNRDMNEEQGLAHLVQVVEGSFEDVQVGESGFNVVWSQDAFLHSGDREKVAGEIDRVLAKEGGRVVFTDPMAAGGADEKKLAPILQRLHLDNLGSLEFYRTEFEKRGFKDLGFEDCTDQMVMHYSRVLKDLGHQDEQLKGKISDEYVQNMKAGLGHWIEGGKTGQLCWGIWQFDR